MLDLCQRRIQPTMQRAKVRAMSDELKRATSDSPNGVRCIDDIENRQFLRRSSQRYTAAGAALTGHNSGSHECLQHFD